MSPLTLLLALMPAVIAAALYAIRPLWDRLSPFSTEVGREKPSGRRRPPVGGTDLHQLWYLKRFYDFHTEVLRRHSTILLLGLFNDYVYTANPANVEYILKTNYTNYAKGEETKERMDDLFGDGIVMVDGNKWRHQRKIASLQFSGRINKNNATAVFRNNAIKLATKISESSNKAEVIAIDDLFVKSTVDSAFEILAGVRLDVLSGQNTEGEMFIKAMDTSLDLIMLRQLVIFWKIMKYFNIGYEARVKKAVKTVDNFLYKVIRDKVKDDQCNAGDQDGHDNKKEDLLSKLIESSSGDSGIIDEKYVRDVLLSFIVAGKDTTAGALSWFIYMLCKHPSVQEKITSEIKEATKSSCNSGAHDVSIEDFAKDITEEAIEKMQYLHAAISETLRLHPPVPLDLKMCMSDDVLPDGFTVRKGDFVGYHPYAMGRMESLWGEDAQVFRPERWLDEHGRFQPESPYKFPVFQAGPRICMGRDFAYRQVKVYAALLLRFFRFEMSDEDATVNYKVSLTLHVDNGLHVYAYSK